MLFDSGQDQLASRTDALKRADSVLKDFREKQVHVAGHTDLVAIKDPLQKKFSFNKAFLDARANNAAQVQRDTGVNSHLSAAGLVDSNSVSSNNTTGERARTDRIELM